MRITNWDNLELQGFKQTNKGNWQKGSNIFYKKICEECGKWYLGYKKSKFCNYKCFPSGENHTLYGLKGKYHPAFGYKHTDETKRKISKSLKGRLHSKEHNRKVSKGLKNSLFKVDKFGEKNPNWDGGYNSNSIPKYDTYAPHIEWCEEVRRNKEDKNVMEVRCFKCEEWFIPQLSNVRNRLQVLKGQMIGESHFYCSDNCKNSCYIYGKKPETLIKEDAVKAGRLPWLKLNREVQPELRKLVLERDKYKCVKCGNIKNLHCHHIYPVSTNPLESADVDNCVTYCIDCHKEAHKKDGCRLEQLEIEIC